MTVCPHCEISLNPHPDIEKLKKIVQETLDLVTDIQKTLAWLLSDEDTVDTDLDDPDLSDPDEPAPKRRY